MFCKVCGNEVEEAKFCSVCGAELAAEEAAPVVAAEEIVEAAPVAEEAAEEVVAVDPGKTLGLVSMILGIVSVSLGSLCTCLAACLGGFIPSFCCGVVGIVLGVIGMKKSKEAGFDNKKAKIGMILSIVGVVLFFLLIIFSAALSSVMQSVLGMGLYG